MFQNLSKYITLQNLSLGLELEGYSKGPGRGFTWKEV
jgi:hypothetical protein